MVGKSKTGNGEWRATRQKYGYCFGGFRLRQWMSTNDRCDQQIHVKQAVVTLIIILFLDITHHIWYDFVAFILEWGTLVDYNYSNEYF